MEPTGGSMTDEHPIKVRRVWRRPVKLALAVACLGILMIVTGSGLSRANFHAYTANSVAMSPTLVSGDFVLAENVGSAALRRGDVVLVKPVGWFSAGPIIKRVIGTGGERIACCKSGQVTIDGRLLDEPYVSSANGGMPNYAVTVPAGRVFLLGDNRADSIDSRMFLYQEQGTLPTSSVIARVLWTSRGGFEAGASKAPLVYIAVDGFGVLFLILGLLALPITLIISARRSRVAKVEPLPTKV